MRLANVQRPTLERTTSWPNRSRTPCSTRSSRDARPTAFVPNRFPRTAWFVRWTPRTTLLPQIDVPLRFLRVETLAEVAVAIKAAKHPLTEAEVRKAAGKILDPPELLVACQVRVADPFSQRDYAAVRAHSESLCFAAGDGVASKWSTGGLTRDPRTWRILGVDPGLLDVWVSCGSDRRAWAISSAARCRGGRGSLSPSSDASLRVVSSRRSHR